MTGSGPAPGAAMSRPDQPAPPATIRKRLGARSIVLIGMMGAGKSTVGRRLAARLGLPFADADTEIEKAAGCSIPEIFAAHGEAYFRDGERRVIARLLDEGPQVVAAGGGAWMNPQTREKVAEKGISVWLKADLDLLRRRVKRRNNRPLLAGTDAGEKLMQLSAERDPVYALADVTVISGDVPHDTVVDDMLSELTGVLGRKENESGDE